MSHKAIRKITSLRSIMPPAWPASLLFSTRRGAGRLGARVFLFFVSIALSGQELQPRVFPPLLGLCRFFQTGRSILLFEQTDLWSRCIRSAEPTAAFGVPDVLVTHLKNGSKLSVYTEVFPNRQFQGFVSAIAAAADSSTRAFQVEVTIPN